MALNQVKKIVDCKFENGQQLYEVKWNNTWEPADKLIPFQKLIDEFWKHINDCKNADVLHYHPKKKRKLDSDGLPPGAPFTRNNENPPTSPTQVHYVRQMSGEGIPVTSQLQLSNNSSQQQQRPGTPQQQQQQRPGTPQQKRPGTPQQHPGAGPLQQLPGGGSQQQIPTTIPPPQLPGGAPGAVGQQQHPAGFSQHPPGSAAQQQQHPVSLSQQQQQHHHPALGQPPQYPVTSSPMPQRPGTPQQHPGSGAQQQQQQSQHPVSQSQPQQLHSPGPPSQHAGQQQQPPGGQKQHPSQKQQVGVANQPPHPSAGPQQSHPGSVPTTHPQQQPGSVPQLPHGGGVSTPPQQQLSPGLQTHSTSAPQLHPSSTQTSATMMMHSQAGPFPTLVGIQAGTPFDIFAQQGFMPGFDPKIFENVQQQRGRGNRGGRGSRGARGSKSAHPAGMSAVDKSSMERQAENMMSPQGHMLIGQLPFDQPGAFMEATSPSRGRGRGGGRGRGKSAPSPNKEMSLGMTIKEEEGVIKQEEFQMGFEMQQHQPPPGFPDGSSPSRGRGSGRGRGRGRGGLFPSPSKNSVLSMNVKDEDSKEDFSSLLARADSYTSSMSKEDANWLEKWQNPYVKLIIVCRLCNKEQKTMNTTVWRAHFLTHSDVKPYNCEICQKGFVQTTAYKNHMKNNHGDLVSMSTKDNNTSAVKHPPGFSSQGNTGNAFDKQHIANSFSKDNANVAYSKDNQRVNTSQAIPSVFGHGPSFFGQAHQQGVYGKDNNQNISS